MTRKHLFSLSLALVGLVSVGASAQAATNVLRNGVTWASTFEGDVSPPTASSPAWATWDTGGHSESSDGDIYTYASSHGSAASYTVQTDWSGTARTFEARVRVSGTGSQAADGTASFLLGVNDVAYDLRIFDDMLVFNDPTNSILGPSVAIDMTQFHTLRLVIDEGASSVVSLYIDGNVTPAIQTNSFWFNSAGFDRIVAGDISKSGVGGDFEVDYYSWTTGAFPPVPEPASMSLIVLGGLVIAARRRQ